MLETIPWCIPCDEPYHEKECLYLTTKEEVKEEPVEVHALYVKAPPVHYPSPVLYSNHQGFVSPFLVTLIFGDRYLHNCVVDSGVESNAMPLKLMKWLGLKINAPCGEISGVNDNAPVQPMVMVRDAEFYLSAEPMIGGPMDILIIVVLETYGVL